MLTQILSSVSSIYTASVNLCRQISPGEYRDGKPVTGNIGCRAELVESQQDTMCGTTKPLSNGKMGTLLSDY